MERQIRVGVLFLFFYVLCGFYGAIWISDNLDHFRVPFYSLFGVPVCFSLLASFFFYTGYWVNRIHILYYLFLAIFLIFAWGNLLFINSVVSSQPKLVRIVKQTDEEKRAYTVRLNQGVLGWYYRNRW